MWCCRTVLPRNWALIRPYYTKSDDVSILKEPGVQVGTQVQTSDTKNWETHVSGGGTADLFNYSHGKFEVALTGAVLLDIQLTALPPGQSGTVGTLALTGVLAAKYTLVGNDESKARLRVYAGVGVEQDFGLWGGSQTQFGGVQAGGGLLLELDPLKKPDKKDK